MGFCGNNNAALRNLSNIVAERFRHRVQRQRAVDEPLNKFEPAHCLLLVVIYDANTFPSRGRCHELSQASQTRARPGEIAATCLHHPKRAGNLIPSRTEARARSFTGFASIANKRLLGTPFLALELDS